MGLLSSYADSMGLLGPSPSFGAGPGLSSLISGLSTPAPQQAAPPPAQGGGLSGLLGGIGHFVGDLASLPANMVHGYASEWADVPKQIAFKDAQRNYALQTAGYNNDFIRSLLPSAGSTANPPGGGLLPSQPPPAQNNGGLLPSGGGTPPTQVSVTPPAPSSPMGQSGGINLLDPATQRRIMLGAAVGNGAATTMLDIGKATIPSFEALRPGSAPMNKLTGQVTGPTLPQDGTFNAPDGKGGFINIPVAGAAVNAAAQAGAVAGGTAAGTAIGQAPYIQSAAASKAAGEGQGSAPYALETRTGADGSPITAPRSYFLSHPLIGQNPASATLAGDQAKDLSGVITADQAQRQPAMVARDNALRAVDIAQNTHFGPDAPGLAAAAKWMQALGVKGDVAQYANNVTAYQQIANQSLLQFAKSNLPSRYTERELTFTKSIFGQIKDPQIAALFSAGTQAAIANKQIARAQYADNYDPASGMSRKQYEAGWAKTPDGASSVYADPIWQHIQVGGKPAVMPTTVRGHSFLVITPGVNPTILKVN